MNSSSLMHMKKFYEPRIEPAIFTRFMILLIQVKFMLQEKKDIPSSH